MFIINIEQKDAEKVFCGGFRVLVEDLGPTATREPFGGYLMCQIDAADICGRRQREAIVVVDASTQTFVCTAREVLEQRDECCAQKILNRRALPCRKRCRESYYVQPQTRCKCSLRPRPPGPAPPPPPPRDPLQPVGLGSKVVYLILSILDPGLILGSLLHRTQTLILTAQPASRL